MVKRVIGPLIIILRPILDHWWTVRPILGHLDVFFIFSGVSVSEELIEFGQFLGILLLGFCCRHLEKASEVKTFHLFLFSLILDEGVARVSRRVTSAINEREKKGIRAEKGMKRKNSFLIAMSDLSR